MSHCISQDSPVTSSSDASLPTREEHVLLGGSTVPFMAYIYDDWFSPLLFESLEEGFMPLLSSVFPSSKIVSGTQ